MKNVLELLCAYIRNEFGYSGDIDADNDLIISGILDSFSIVTLAVFAQDEFGVEFEAEDLTRENLASLSNLVALIRRRQGEGEALS